MARSPIPIETELAPFAEGTPLDDLQVENIDNDEVLIGDPELDEVSEDENNFDAKTTTSIFAILQDEIKRLKKI